jgi:hypothetical protein
VAFSGECPLPVKLLKGWLPCDMAGDCRLLATASAIPLLSFAKIWAQMADYNAAGGAARP